MRKFRPQVGLILALLILDLFLALFWRQQTSLSSPPNNYPEIQELAGKDYNFQQLKDFFTNLAQSKGAEYTYQVLKIAPISPNTDMHLMGHVVGDILYKQRGLEGIKICTEDFRNACSHTIVVGLLLDKGESVLPQIGEACRQAPGGTGAYTMCYHGLGHGVLAYTNYDLPKAIELCKKTGTKEYQNREYVECVGGTIMEIISGGDHDKKTWSAQRQKYFKKNDPLYPCSSDFMPEEALNICYIYLTPHLFQFSGANLGSPTADNFKTAFTYCNKLPVSDLARRDACYGGFGKEFTVLASARDIRVVDQMNDKQLTWVYEWCKLADTKAGAAACIVHGVNSLYWGGENNRGAAIRFCTLMSEDYHQKSCFLNLISSVSSYIKDQSYRQEFCTELPIKFQEECQRRLI